MILTFINFSWRLWAQIKHVYLIKFTQVVWLLTNWWIGMNETNLTQHGRSTDVNASDILYPKDTKKIWKKMEYIKNDVLLWQFMLCKNINQYNNGQCKSSSDYKGAGIWIGKLMRGRINTSKHWQLNIVLTSTLTLNALLLCMVKQPNLERE